jgi:hypothetical protein
MSPAICNICEIFPAKTNIQSDPAHVNKSEAG